DSLSPLKDGINPFSIDTTIFPLYGPIDNHAPNDWLEVDGITYAPDENYLGESHMWKSDDMLNWVDMGPITGINGSDPGMVFDGEFYYLFNEDGNALNYNKLSFDFTNIVEGQSVLDVGDHTGDADLGFFNNQWHMFFDDGPHLHYNIGNASTTPEEFPFGWIKENDIYGPHNPEQGQRWDDDTKEGNDFGTGDADIAIEGNTLYMFTERPVGAAYKELTELYDGTGLNIEALVEVDENGDGIADDSTGWKKIVPGKTVWSWSKELSGQHFRLSFKLNSENSTESPMIQYFKLSSEHSKPVRLNLNTDLPKILNFRDSISTVTCSITDSQDRLSVAADSLVFFSLIGNGNLEGDNPMRAQQGKATITYVPGAAVGRQIIVAESAGLLSDTVTIDVDNRLLVDDFENYESENDLSLVWHGHAGLTADLFLNRLDDGTDLGYAYRVGNGSPPFSGIFHNFDYDLSGISHLGFWLKADSSSREFIIRLEEGGIRDWDYSLPMNDSEFSNFQIDLNNFTANDGAEKIDIQALSKLSFFVLPGDGGFGADTIYIDEISFLSHQVSRLPKKLTVKNPADFKLYKNFPNPFNPATKIRFSLPFSTKIELTIFDVLGRRVKKLLNSDEKAGEHEIEFDGSGLSSGIYIYALRAEAWHDSKKMLLLK
ncbi:MAG: T9SS type A sorting domain-containing protein, partial [Gammaproteobacteria bacterium]|nr:T9SS type A sorting domain-containing protein [Gammaproteobacteria bacterium]